MQDLYYNLCFDYVDENMFNDLRCESYFYWNTEVGHKCNIFAIKVNIKWEVYLFIIAIVEYMDAIKIFTS